MAAVALPARSQVRRNSPRSFLNNSTLGRFDVDSDSDTDDEPPPAIKFSKVTQALLANDAPILSPVQRVSPQAGGSHFRSASVDQAGLDTPSRASKLRIIRQASSPVVGGVANLPAQGRVSPRVVYVNSRNKSVSEQATAAPASTHSLYSSLRRDASADRAQKSEVVTPAQTQRAGRVVRPRAGSNASEDGAVLSLSRPQSRTGIRPILNSAEKHSRAVSAASSQPEGLSKVTVTTASRARNTSAEPPMASASQRMKRVPVGTTGSFFKSRPVRGTFRRRESDDNASAQEDAQSSSGNRSHVYDSTPQEGGTGRRSRAGSINGRATSVEPAAVPEVAPQSSATHERPGSRQGGRYLSRSQMSAGTRPGSRQSSTERSRSRQPSLDRHAVRKEPTPVAANGTTASEQQPVARASIEIEHARPGEEPKATFRVTSINRPTYRYVSGRGTMDAADDQENVPPPTFKRNRDQDIKYIGKTTLGPQSDDEKPKPRMIDETPVPMQQQKEQQHRKALGPVSGNTPHRPAPPPPPKMNVLEAATSTAGASTLKARKKRNHVVINGKTYSQMSRLGRGGSSDVYLVMAENLKLFAWKKVRLDEGDDLAIEGYKGEIDLLTRLTGVERVVQLFDHEINEEKHELHVVMEKGESDLNRLLTSRSSGGEVRFDSAFVRFYWKEMLECVQAVHEHDIVHSDLKPANFLLVSGRLKLIDFGIANAIETDHTCNVHRENHVGTPNYMSPESITDTNTANGRNESGRPGKKDMRIGKSSDVWSLGCILYQMTYGRPPFAHIPNQITRIMAITNPRHVIEFPSIGSGGVVVPPALKSTLKKCLNRDADKRPTVSKLLEETDPFLNPDGYQASSVLVDEFRLQNMINMVSRHVGKNGLPTEEQMAAWSRNFITQLRSVQEQE